jgi:hypothetical protein
MITATASPSRVPESLADAPGWAQRLYLFLCRRGYPHCNAAALTAHAQRWGTLWCSGLIDEEDVALGEELLPSSPAWGLAAWDRITCTTTEGL